MNRIYQHLGSMPLDLAQDSRRVRYQVKNLRENFTNLGEVFEDRTHFYRTLCPQQVSSNLNWHFYPLPTTLPPHFDRSRISMTKDSKSMTSMAKEFKPRLRWNTLLHSRFVQAVNQLGGPNFASPKNIKNVMNIPELTIPQVKSHLQKYRLKTLKNAQRDGAGQERMPKNTASSSSGPKPFGPGLAPLGLSIMGPKPFGPSSSTPPPRGVNNYAREAPVTEALQPQPISKPTLVKVKVEKADHRLEGGAEHMKIGMNPSMEMMGFPNPMVLVKQERVGVPHLKFPPWKLVGREVAGGGSPAEDPSAKRPI